MSLFIDKLKIENRGVTVIMDKMLDTEIVKAQYFQKCFPYKS